MDKTFQLRLYSYFSSQITCVEGEAVDFSRFRFHRKRTASTQSTVHLLHQVMTTIGYIVKRQWSVKRVSNHRTAAYFIVEKQHLLLRYIF